MKKIIFFLFICFSIVFKVNAQYLTAFNNLTTYQTGGAQDHDALKKAAEAIDVAVKDERSGIQGKTWYYRGYIYQIVWEDTAIRSEYPNALLTASESYQKSFNVGDTKYKQADDAKKNLVTLGSQLQIQASYFFEQAQYKEAQTHFLEVSNIKKFLAGLGVEKNIDDSHAKFNAVIVSQKIKDEQTAVKLLAELVDEGYDNAIIYSILADIYINEKKLDEAKKVLDKAALKYPENTAIIISQLNIYILEGRANEHLDKMLKAISLEPDNHGLHYALGVTYQGIADDLKKAGKTEEAKANMVKAEASYKEAVKIKPGYYEALNNLATIYITKANELKTLMDDPKLSDAKYKEYQAQRETNLKKALEFLEPAYAAEPNGREVLIMLKEIYAITGEYEKSKQIKAKLDSLK
jgi:thioredoxin-like negative regulator of GroEL